MNDLIILTLSCGRHVIIDAVDAELVRGYNWYSSKPGHGNLTRYAHGYRRGEKRKHVYLHRLLMDPPPHLQVDHINRDGLDCRRANLRNVTPAENCENRRDAWQQHRYRGVRRRQDTRRWVASCKVGSRLYSEEHDTAEQAARAYDRLAKEHFGERAKLNFPDNAPS
jgi:hypothetical protein